MSGPILTRSLVGAVEKVLFPAEVVLDVDDTVAGVHHHLSKAGQRVLHEEPQRVLQTGCRVQRTKMSVNFRVEKFT